MQRDREVNRKLEALGFTVFRFWSKEILTDLDTCIKDIMVYIETGKNDW
ncbi:DUF559 domain-containing protein [Hanstruepera marina]|nr:DUF559 domain-containing protein [Hanstruepera marina]